MIEVYLFYAAFLAQVILFSLFYPIKFSGKMNATINQHSLEIHPEPVDDTKAKQRTFRILSFSGAVIGLLLLAYFVSYMRSAGWDDGPVETGQLVFFFVQVAPVLLLQIVWLSYCRRLKHAASSSIRKAEMQPRHLFDFISPATIALALFLYIAYCALVVYIAQEPFPGFAGITINIAIPTLVNIVFAVIGFWSLYGKKPYPSQTNQNRLLGIGITIKAAVYSSIAASVKLSIGLLLPLLDLQSYEPLSHSLYYILVFYLMFQVVNTTFINNGLRSV